MRRDWWRPEFLFDSQRISDIAVASGRAHGLLRGVSRRHGPRIGLPAIECATHSGLALWDDSDWNRGRRADRAGDGMASIANGKLTVREFFPALLGFISMPACLRAQEPDTIPLKIGGATIEVTFGSADFDLPRERLLSWIRNAATAVSRYYGAFPVPRMRLRVNSSERRTGVFGGTSWGRTPYRTPDNECRVPRID